MPFLLVTHQVNSAALTGTHRTFSELVIFKRIPDGSLSVAGMPGDAAHDLICDTAPSRVDGRDETGAGEVIYYHVFNLPVRVCRDQDRRSEERCRYDRSNRAPPC